MFKIVSYRPGRNVTSDDYADNAIDLLGEIQTVSLYLFL